ncbi:3-dehydroquinate synthase [Spongiibacter sp. IMCC21906]|uniref:3-dehydroquinate synthase n=1 Tax=Spongiibacter sp. IMCC21906 TaxID=1620392 RepID=UPI00062DD2E6|nr:3-dehydroquinate synthase [Spongiibacter sp. IMCC21906]AKH70498.1 3-dehydroquinate synthase [Spongiibacter sp. IMCC21906]
MKQLNVDLGDRSYPIFIGSEVMANSDLWRQFIRGKQLCIVSNETVAPLYLPALKAQLDGFDVLEVVLPDGEQHKNLNTLNTIFDALLSRNQNRSTTLIALGGGVVGDMCGFAAACYQRGVNFIQLPTTLLSMVDSSVGGKTGVNHSLGKNMIGAFHQPQCVVADLSVLGSLPDKEFSAGMAEVIKYGLICDVTFFQWLEDNIVGLMARDTALLAEAVYRSCVDKAAVVAEDETEQGRRAILNLGHTFGHAIETAEGYGSWLHGEAVAAGMVLAVTLSEKLGWVSAEVVERSKSLLSKANLPLLPPSSMNLDQFLQLMGRDKKVIDGRLRLVLLKALGDAIVTSDVPVSMVKTVLQEAGVKA